MKVLRRKRHWQRKERKEGSRGRRSRTIGQNNLGAEKETLRKEKGKGKCGPEGKGPHASKAGGRGETSSQGTEQRQAQEQTRTLYHKKRFRNADRFEYQTEWYDSEWTSGSWYDSGDAVNQQHTPAAEGSVAPWSTDRAYLATL